MDFGIGGKVAMVAAASKGLGKAIALSLAREGCRVSICARGAESLASARAELAAAGAEALALGCDIASAPDLERWHRETVARFGAVDILVTNTGGPKAAPFGALEDPDWAAGVESTLMNVVRLTRLVVPGMVERGWGRIVHLTSLVAKQPALLLTISSTIRSGLSGLTKTLSQEYARNGITVNAVLPGNIMTDRQLHLAELKSKADGSTVEEYFARTAASIPAGRLGRPEEVGDCVAFLCGERASYINGVSLQVDGGIIASTF